VADADAVGGDEDDLGAGHLDVLGELPLVEEPGDAAGTLLAVGGGELLGEEQPVRGPALAVEQDEPLPLAADIPGRDRREEGELLAEVPRDLAHRGGIGARAPLAAARLRPFEGHDRVADRAQLVIGRAPRSAFESPALRVRWSLTVAEPASLAVAPVDQDVNVDAG